MDIRNNFFVSDVLPYLGSFIIFLGMTRLMTYYSSFGVNIINYLEFSEIITSFFDIILIVVFVILYSTIQNFLLINKSAQNEKLLFQNKIEGIEKFTKRLLQYFLYYLEFICSAIFIFIGYYIYSLFNKNIDKNVLIGQGISSVLFFVFLIISFEINIKHKHIKSTINDKNIIDYFLFSLLFIAYTMFISYNQVHFVKDKKSTYGTIIKLNDNTVLQSDSNNYYIGKTQKFLFFYHEYTKTTDVIPVSNLKCLTTVKISD
jgi:hypothetical protein